MFGKIRISYKLITGFAVVAVITLGVGASGWWSVGRLSAGVDDVAKVRLPGVAALLTVEKNIESIRVAVRTLLNPALKPEDRARQLTNIEAARNKYVAAEAVYDALPQSAEGARLWDEFKPAVEAWAKENTEFLRMANELDATAITNPKDLIEDLERFRGDHYSFMSEVLAVMSTGSLMVGGKDASSCNFGQWLNRQSIANPRVKEVLAKAAPVHESFHRHGARIGELIMKGSQFEAVTVFSNDMQAAADEIFGHLEALRAEALRAEEIYDGMNRQAMGPCVERQRAALGLLEKLVALNEEAAAGSVKAAGQVAGVSGLIALTGALAGFGSALALGWLLSASISRALRRVIAGLSEGAEQVASASAQVSAASQGLAAGSSQQAAGIEETSSSLEEMASMTRRNADNAGQADRMMKEALAVVQKADGSVRGLTASMQEISRASEETSKIIRTIDEIAFQTNLLALNAAVEAARAGQAGAGFAVVADEVRNLAMRAAEAARSTAGLIEGTVQKVKTGSQTVAETSAAFAAIAGQTARVSELVAEIAAASGEQSQGIAQVSSAVTEIDKVTQQNAAGAEESASAAEEMSAQAEQMKAMVGELVAMVEGARREAAAEAGGTEIEARGESAISSGLPPDRRPAYSKNSEQVIPLDDEESSSI